NPTDAEWADIFDLVSRGPSVWGDAGPTVGDIGQGCGMPEPLHDVAARFPCELLKSIAMVESGWRQFCVPTTPSDQVGGPSRTIISFDCGYGVGQVTSGMHTGENPDFDRARVASDATYNLATGTRILAGKWIATNCVGDNQPTIIEDWYTATWAYNGLAYVNNPSNPNYDSNRGVYDPAVNNACPYQERVFGRIENPTGDLWPSVALAYPNPGDCGSSGSPPALPEPDCASPTDCADTRSVHVTACIDSPGTGGGGGGGVGGGATNAVGSGGAASATTASGAGGNGGAGGGGSDGIDAPGGCGCEVPSGGGASPFAIAGLAALALAVARRARRSR
ncbi:MAG TPA: MYXO-CTERM sorting domain-containing protein, partial [Polyangiaceae bacterium]|nr:MYXO-CTERM sorting domain-containing protein [Polyangiaceae bacterium]